MKTAGESGSSNKFIDLCIKNSFAIMKETGWQQSLYKQRSFLMNIHTIAQGLGNCKYHVVSVMSDRYAALRCLQALLGLFLKEEPPLSYRFLFLLTFV